MTLLTIIITVSVVAALVRGALYLVRYVRDDGHSHPRTSGPPLSHEPDVYEPRWNSGWGRTA